MLLSFGFLKRQPTIRLGTLTWVVAVLVGLAGAQNHKQPRRSKEFATSARSSFAGLLFSAAGVHR